MKSNYAYFTIQIKRHKNVADGALSSFLFSDQNRKRLEKVFQLGNLSFFVVNALNVDQNLSNILTNCNRVGMSMMIN
jgi:hypothetical protein